jgi:hypothetical protein
MLHEAQRIRQLARFRLIDEEKHHTPSVTIWLSTLGIDLVPRRDDP